MAKKQKNWKSANIDDSLELAHKYSSLLCLKAQHTLATKSDVYIRLLSETDEVQKEMSPIHQWSRECL